MNHRSKVLANVLLPRPVRGARRLVFVWLLLAVTLNLTIRPAAAGCGGGGGILGTLVGGPIVGGLIGAGEAAGCAADQAQEVIETAGREARETVVVAGDQQVRVVRAAGYQAEQVAATIGDETRGVVMVASNEAQNVLGVAGDTLNDVLHTAGSEAERLTVIASREAQTVAHVTGAEARATAAALGAEFQEVVMLISDESMAVTRQVGEEARLVVRAAGEEARLTLDHFQANNERLLQQISETYQGNLDITIDSLDEGSRRMLENYYDSLIAVNEILVYDMLLVEASSQRVIAGAGDEAGAAINHLESSMTNLIMVAGETTVYLVDRTTNNVITVMAIILTGLGLLLLIYLFFVHQMPVGKSARFVYAFMVVYLIGFGLLIASPTARVYAMRSAQVGLRAELEKSTDPQVILYRVIPEGADNEGARIEVNGRHLLAGAGRPTATLDGHPLAVGIASDESLTFPLDAATAAALHESTLPLVIDFGRPELLATIDLHIIDPFDTVKSFEDEREPVVLIATGDAETAVFAGPDTAQYAQLGALAAGVRYQIVGRDSARTWWAILWDDAGVGRAWVPDHLVLVIGAPILIPVIEADSPTVTPTPTATSDATPTRPPTATATPTITATPCVWTATARMNAHIRSGPGEVYDVIGTLREGESAAVIGRSMDEAWSVIDAGGRQGWVADAVVVLNSCSGEWPPTVPAPATPTPSPTPVVAYRSCAEIRDARPGAADDAYTLYVDGDINKPFVVFCYGMASNPAEYLPLPNSGVGGNANYSHFVVGGATRGTDQYEYFHLVRLNPFTLEIDRSDRTFATMVGRYEYKPEYEDTHDWRRMNYGEARSCIRSRDSSSRANIDLSGTPFALHTAAVAEPTGFLPAGQASFSSGRQVVDVQGGGFCGGMQLKPLILTYVGR